MSAVDATPRSCREPGFISQLPSRFGDLHQQIGALYYSENRYIQFRKRGCVSTRRGLSELGRFSEPALLILLSLATGEKHGYAMLLDIERHFGVQLGPATLYGTIERLELRGLLVPLPSSDRRRPYRITDAGRAELEAELASMETLVRAGRRRLAES
jgi:DNA-binding PadR family transcriptional regulator